MSRPFIDTFENEQLPTSPASATSINTPISYKTNVNRAKTTKWANAKPASYGGDDWGDDDGYDDGYDMPPPPISKPTGFRQQGQAIQTAQTTESTVVGKKKNYGDLPPIPSAAESSLTRPRANSFDAEDERRNFSKGSVQQSSPAPPTVPGPATRFSQITGQPTSRLPSGAPALSISTEAAPPRTVVGLRKGLEPLPASGSPHPDVVMSVRTNNTDTSSVYPPKHGSRTPSIDYQARQDDSPSIIVPPSNTRASSAPQNTTDSPSGRFDPRKTSLNQSVGPDVSEIMHSPQEGSGHKLWAAVRSSSPNSSARSPAKQEGSVSKPWIDAGGRSSPSSATRSSSAQGKALPFIRPADIYKRMEEEREKERQSPDSGRPSMDSIVGARSDSPAARQLKESSSSDSLRNGSRRRTSVEGDDASDSGRLKPILEPVKERKSEYGFEGFNVIDQVPPSTAAGLESSSSERDAREVDRVRQSSTSPKLPDLNRISGFGMDIFAQHKPQEAEVPSARHREVTPTTTSNNSFQMADDPSLRNQPDLGFRSVVNQAFDRRGDSSMPDTPSSRSDSDVRRTDSESTGTAGISPIMSRVPSSAAPDSRNRDISNPSILEVVDEANAIAQHDVESSNAPPSFKSGHRRDISTPIPENSAEKALDAAKRTSFTPDQGAVVFGSSPSSSLEAYQDQLQPPRPIAQREGSFRPNIPGGWTSFTSSAIPSETSDSDAPDTKGPTIHTQAPPIGPRPDHQSGNEDELATTPTTTQHNLPQSAFEIAALGAAGGHTVSRDKESPMGTPRTGTPMIDEPRHFTSNEALPNPAPTNAHGGNFYSTIALDPRGQSGLEKAPLETQLRPDTVNRAISENSSEAPTPPDKDSPVVAQEDSVDYFYKATVPPKQRALDEVEADERLQPPTKPQVSSTLIADTGEQDDENDKLRKEIMRSLSPKPSNAPKHNDSSLSENLDDQSALNPARISSYLPSEYDNYWATSNDEEASAPVVAARPQDKSEDPIQKQAPAEIPRTSPHDEPEPPIIQPLSPHNPERSLDRPPMHVQRFSWQASAEDVSVLTGHRREQHESDVSTGEHQFTGHQTEIEAKLEPESEQTLSEPIPHARHDPLRSHPTNDESHFEKDATLLADGVALGGTTAAYSQSLQSHGQPSRRLSLAEEKDPTLSSFYPVSPTPPEDQHPAKVSETRLSTHADHLSDPYAPSATFVPSVSSAPPSSVSPVNSPVQPHFSPQNNQSSKIMAFREIVAMKSPQQRIQTFDEMRHKVASVDYGLTDWMKTMKAQHEEHANASSAYDGSRISTFANGSARGKFGKTPADAPPPLQQPYYQQYLNASSPTTPSTQVSRPGPSTPVGSQQGLSPAANKLTTQQVQAKGKELLHTAGIFGGKAGKAGKGLLAKGKNKLRAAGGGDKKSTSPSTPPTKSDRRTSWGNALTISRSSGRPDNSSRDSKEIIRPFQSEPRQRAATLTLDTNHPPALSKMNAATDDSYGIMSAPGTSDNLDFIGALPTINQSPLTESPPDRTQKTIVSHKSENKAPDRQDPEDRIGLNVPAPIGKNQPSWEPLNATPITEEEGFQWEERPKHQSQPVRHADETGAFAISTKPAASSAGSKNRDVSFHNAQEYPSDLSDWVVVPKDVGHQLEPKALDAPSKPDIQPANVVYRLSGSPKLGKTSGATTSSVMNRPRGDTVTSILDRPRYSYDVPREIRPTDLKPPLAQPKVALQQSRPPPAKDYFSVAQLKSVPTGHVPAPVDANFSRPAQQQNFIEEYQPLPGPPQPHPSFQSVEAQHREVDTASATSFKGLPPIRRSSTFGLGFGTREARKRFAIEDEKELPPAPQQSGVSAASGAQQNLPLHQSQLSDGQQSQIPPPISSSLDRPGMVHNGSSEESQRTVNQTQTPAPQSQQLYNVLKAPDFPPPIDDISISQDAERSNTVVSPVQLLHSASEIPPPRQSIEQQRTRAPSFTQRPEILANNRVGRAVPNQQAKSFEVPPSAAQRYPDLFPQEQPGGEAPRDVSEIPASNYQPPVPREAAFLRQQTNEYQITGVGPPANEAHPSSNRKPGIFKDLGEKIRSASRERRSSVSRDGAMRFSGYDIQGTEYAPSSIASEETQEQESSRNSFFGIIRASTVGMGPPRSRESMLAHNPGSRSDLLLSTQSSPIASHNRKRSFFGSIPSDQKLKASNLLRATTSGLSDEPGRKKRFSGLSSIFGGRSSKDTPSSIGSTTSGRQQAARELLHHERQPIESPAPDQSKLTRQPVPQNLQAPQQNLQSPQQRDVLMKVTTGMDSSQPRQESKTRQSVSAAGFLNKFSSSGTSSQPSQDTSAREPSNTRKPQSAGLLNGFMGLRSDKHDKSYPSSQGARSQSSKMQYHANQVPPAQTYPYLQDQSNPPRQSTQAAPVSRQGQPKVQQKQQPIQQQAQHQPNVQASERGRRSSREPQYDSVPIPGGYSLVHGHGNVPIDTGYDPRGYNRGQQVDPRYAQEPRVTQNPPPLLGGPLRLDTRQSTPNPRPVDDRRALDNRPVNSRAPKLRAVQTPDDYHSSTRRLSREDLLARSPARDPEGQQRPYQLSLPEDTENREVRPTPVDKDVPITSQPGSVRAPSSIQASPIKLPQQNSIQRLNQPILRHPQSPAGYPLPEDTVFSPVDPRANNLPPPPTPKLPAHLDNTDPQQLLLNPDLDRSNTHRTAVSGVSQISGLSGSQLQRLAPRNSLDQEILRQITPSPTPPTPGITPPPQNPPEHEPVQGLGAVQTATVQRVPSTDLYDASPRLQPKVPDLPTHENGRSAPGVENQGFQPQQRRETNPQEEKIFYDKDRPGAEDEIDDELGPAIMSATSYPGQEWNPYAGVYDDEY